MLTMPHTDLLRLVFIAEVISVLNDSHSNLAMLLCLAPHEFEGVTVRRIACIHGGLRPCTTSTCDVLGPRTLQVLFDQAMLLYVRRASSRAHIVTPIA
jgi:hypothetical protein